MDIVEWYGHNGHYIWSVNAGYKFPPMLVEKPPSY